MHNELGKAKIGNWAVLSQKRQARNIFYCCLAFFLAMTAVNPFFYSATGLLAQVLADNEMVSIYDKMTSAGVMLVYMILSASLAVITLSGFYTEGDYDIKGNKFKSQAIEHTTLTFKTLSAQKILTEKPRLFEGRQKLLYEVAGTGKHVLPRFLFDRNTGHRILTVSIFSLAINGTALAIAGGSLLLIVKNWQWNIAYALLVAIVVMIVEAISSASSWKIRDRKLKVIANDNKNRGYCEYSGVVNIDPTLCKWRISEQLWSEIPDKKWISTTVTGLDAQNTIDRGFLEKIGMIGIATHINKLSEETYAAMIALNDSSLDETIEGRKREDDVEALQSIADKYLPACIEAIKTHQKNANVGTITESAKKGYLTLLDNIKEQTAKVIAIKSPYVESNDKLLTVQIMSNISAVSEKIMAIGSPKVGLDTNFISNKLNTNVIPDIKDKMVGASAEDIGRLEAKINEVKQLIKDKEYLDLPSESREVFISKLPEARNGRAKSEIDNYLRYLDSYLDGIRNNW